MNFMIKILKISATFPLNSGDSKFLQVTWYKQNINELTTNNSNNVDFMIKILKISTVSLLNSGDYNYFQVTWYKQNMNDLTTNNNF